MYILYIPKAITTMILNNYLALYVLTEIYSGPYRRNMKTTSQDHYRFRFL